MSTSDVSPGPAGPAGAVARPERPQAEPRGRGAGIWWTRRAVGMHAAIVLAVPGFIALFWWQVQRVREGNTLSWAYVFEWPFFTAYAIYMWWRLVHDQTDTALHGAGVAAPADTPADTAQDEELAAYNRYLAELHASGPRKRW